MREEVISYFYHFIKVNESMRSYYNLMYKGVYDSVKNVASIDATWNRPQSKMFTKHFFDNAEFTCELTIMLCFNKKKQNEQCVKDAISFLENLEKIYYGETKVQDIQDIYSNSDDVPF